MESGIRNRKMEIPGSLSVKWTYGESVVYVDGHTDRGICYFCRGIRGNLWGDWGIILCSASKTEDGLETSAAEDLHFMVLCSLYLGFTSKGVDNSAHIGGVISGILLAAILYHKKKYPNGRDSQLKEEAKL